MSEARLPPTPRSTIRRVPVRASYDREEIYEILDHGMLAHVGVSTKDGPVVIPMAYARRNDSFLLHGSVQSRLMTELAAGAEVCVTVTFLDGLVLARSAFFHSMNYRSVVVLGRATAIEDPKDKAIALEHLIEYLVPGRGADVRSPNDKEIELTLVVEVPIREASAKTRTGPPGDYPEDLAIEAWAGVLPLRVEMGVPIADEHTSAQTSVPEYVRNHTRGHA